MVLMGVGALAVDLTYIDYQQMRMQSAADAAAVAGAQQLVTHGCPDESDAKTAAQNDSQVDNFTPSRKRTRPGGQPADYNRRTVSGR